jgi:hypothetical protein
LIQTHEAGSADRFVGTDLPDCRRPRVPRRLETLGILPVSLALMTRCSRVAHNHAS